MVWPVRNRFCNKWKQKWRERHELKTKSIRGNERTGSFYIGRRAREINSSKDVLEMQHEATRPKRLVKEKKRSYFFKKIRFRPGRKLLIISFFVSDYIVYTSLPLFLSHLYLYIILLILCGHWNKRVHTSILEDWSTGSYPLYIVFLVIVIPTLLLCIWFETIWPQYIFCSSFN